MKAVITILSAAFLVSSFGFSADAATKKLSMEATHKMECQNQAKEKYSAVHLLKRRAYVKECMGKAA